MARGEPTRRARSPSRAPSPARSPSPAGCRSARETVYVAEEIGYDDVLSCLTKTSHISYKSTMANSMIRQSGLFGSGPNALSFISYGACAPQDSSHTLVSDVAIKAPEDKNKNSTSGAANMKAGGGNAHMKASDHEINPFFVCELEIPYESLAAKANGKCAKQNLSQMVRGGICGSKGGYGYISYL
ncbi:hypothetical protein EJB05_19145 [Eragrostis curvula]|uniref:Uncharacterized protein n=1 Tax=Eragrostis curvula TaxID=38414 RepID=A0A5J9UUT0_9POAL|nr:hypothetical protein EJB05_19145 [Eragrostis curvula]